jgi:hypothetical protein
MFEPPEYGIAVALEDDDIGAAGSALESIAISPLAPGNGWAASFARRLNAGIRKMTNAAVAIILGLILIVASQTARRDSLQSHRRMNSARIGHARQRIA